MDAGRCAHAGIMVKEARKKMCQWLDVWGDESPVGMCISLSVPCVLAS